MTVAPSRVLEPSGPVQLIFEDKKRDLALLRVQANAPGLEIAEGHKFSAGEDVRIVGNPRVGGRNHISPGILSTQATIDGQEFDQLAAPINPGDSGGPVLDGQGRVIGVASMKASREQGIAFSIPARDLRAALDAVADDEKDVDALTQRHEARVLLKNLALAGSIDALAVGEGGTAPGATGSGQLASARVPQEAREGWNRQLRDVGLDSLEDEEQVFARIAASPNISTRTKGDLDQLRRLVNQLHGQVVGGGMGAAGPVVGQPRKRIAQLAGGLATELGTEIDELAAWAPPLELVSLKFAYGMRTGKASADGKVRNTSGGVLEGVHAQMFFFHPQTGQVLVRWPKKVMPDRIEPGQWGSFHANLTGLFDPRVIRVVLFTDAEGHFLPFRRPESE